MSDEDYPGFTPIMDEDQIKDYAESNGFMATEVTDFLAPDEAFAILGDNTPEYMAEFSGKFARASLYTSERTRPVLEKHFLATTRSPESLEPDEAAHALKLNLLRDELLRAMQDDLSGKGKRKKKNDE